MWIKVLFILTFITNGILYSYGVNNDIVFGLGDLNCGGDHVSRFFRKEKELNFQILKNYETELRKYENVRFNEIKIYPIQWEEIKEHPKAESSLCGFILSTNYIDNNYHISYSVGYYEGNNFDDFKRYPIYCNLQQCDLGLVFFDKKYSTYDLNKATQEYQVEHAVLIVVKSSDNKMLLGTIKHHHTRIRLSVCPYINWVPIKGELKFIPADHIKVNGYTESKNGNAHIVVPFYKKNENSEIFICGKLKQPTMPDLDIGFKLKQDGTNMDTSEKVINPLEDDLKCHTADDLSKFYHFGYSEKETNYMSDRRMDMIRIRDINSDYKFYAGQKIYIYDWKNIEDSLTNADPHLRLQKTHVTEDPKCIKDLKENIPATILPTIGTIDSIQYNPDEKIFYRLIKYEDLEKKYIFKCLSKIEGKNKIRMDEFYSRTAEFSIKNEEKPDLIYTLAKNEIIFHANKIDNYGSYRCMESKATKYFKSNIINMDRIYYLPDNNFELALYESYLGNNRQQLIGCTRIYGSLGNLKKMTVDFGENNITPIDFDNFSMSTDKIDVQENIVVYKVPKDVFGFTIICTYVTPAKTTFFTKKNVHSYNLNDNEGGRRNGTSIKEVIVTKYRDNSTPWVIGIVIIVIIFCITVIIIAFLIARKIRKRKKNNSSLSFLSGSSFSDSSSMSSSSTSNKSSISMSNVSKPKKTSKTNNYSSNASKNSSSTIPGKKYYRNIKLAAK